MKKTQRNAKFCAVVLIDGASPSGIQVQFFIPQVNFRGILGPYGPDDLQFYNFRFGGGSFLVTNQRKEKWTFPLFLFVL